MNKIALMDSNNFKDNCGVGEREARVFSSIVRNKNFQLGHGIGRSGDVNAL
jgi:O-phospho-L-seryl-tRNASec:L-selenocysteinyl-tRNA synthase